MVEYEEDTLITMPTVYHFDIPVNNANRAQQFYKDVFGWNMKKLNSQADPKVDLWMCETEDENGRKGITGGMMKTPVRYKKFRQVMKGFSTRTLTN